MSALTGLDVSHHSGTIDWNTVVAQAHPGFVYLKASEGMDDADSAYAQNDAALAQLGVPHGAYHFYVTEDDPTTQAQFFLSCARVQSGDLLPVVDIEVLGQGSGSDLPAALRTFLDVVESAVGCAPMIYTTAGFWNQYFDGSFGRYPLWVAEYEVASPKLPNGWTSWALWQFAENVAVPGIPGGADNSQLGAGFTIDQLRVPRRA